MIFTCLVVSPIGSLQIIQRILCIFIGVVIEPQYKK